MSQIVSLVVNNADKIPLVGSPLGWYRNRSHSQETEPETPPPPYEPSRLTQISDYVWKRASFSSSNTNPTPQAIQTKHQTIQEENEEAGSSSNEMGETDKAQLNEGIQLIQMATQMNHAAVDPNSQQISVNLYMLGLDKILSSLPIQSNPILKSGLEKKLIEIKQKCGLILFNENDANNRKPLTEEEKTEALGGLSNLIIQFSVLLAVTLKKSPIPGIVSRLVEVTKSSIHKIDETCLITERTTNITKYGLQKAIEMDKHYEVHQVFAELFYTACTAFMKASIAYSEVGQEQQEQEQ